MPFIDNPAPPATGPSRWMNVVATALSSSLYDSSEEFAFVQEGVVDDLSDTLPPYAGADEGTFTLAKHLGGEDSSDVLVFEMRGSGGGAGGDGDSDEGPSPRWSAAAETSHFGLTIDAEGGTEGSVTYASNPWRYLSSGTGLFSADATTAKELALSLKLGPICAKMSGEVVLPEDRGPASAPTFIDINQCSASVKFALPEDIFCGHVLPPHFVEDCQRNLYMGCTWRGGVNATCDVLRAMFAFNTIGYDGGGGFGSPSSGSSSPSPSAVLRSLWSPSVFQYGVWGSFTVYRGSNRMPSSASSYYRSASSLLPSLMQQGGGGAGREGAISSSSSSAASSVVGGGGSNSDGGDDGAESTAAGGLKIVHTPTGAELCVGVERFSNGDYDTTFGLRKAFSNWCFPYTVSVGKTTDGDWGAAVGVQIVDVGVTLGAHRRSDAEGGLFGALPTFGLNVEF